MRAKTLRPPRHPNADVNDFIERGIEVNPMNVFVFHKLHRESVDHLVRRVDSSSQQLPSAANRGVAAFAVEATRPRNDRRPLTVVKIGRLIRTEDRIQGS